MSRFEVRVITTAKTVESFMIEDDRPMGEAKRRIINRFSTPGSSYTFIDTKQKIHVYPASSIVSITVTPMEDV